MRKVAAAVAKRRVSRIPGVWPSAVAVPGGVAGVWGVVVMAWWAWSMGIVMGVPAAGVGHGGDHEGCGGHGEGVVGAFDSALGAGAEEFVFGSGDGLDGEPERGAGEQADLGEEGGGGQVPEHGCHQGVHEGVEGVVDPVGEVG